MKMQIIMEENTNRGEILIYQMEDGTASIDVKLENETVWLTQMQIAILFGVNRPAVTKHLKNIFECGELEYDSVCSILEQTAADGKTYRTAFYNLDAVLSVGYRTNSKNAVAFRRWASHVLKEYLVKGYAVRQQLMESRYLELKQLVQVLGRTVRSEALSDDQTRSILDVVVDYSYGLDTLDSFDYQNLSVSHTTNEEKFRVTFALAMDVIAALRNKFGASDLFGLPKDQSFASSIGQIYQTWDGKDLYPSVEEKAAMLLYLVVKNHSFIDGNKRIAATLFLWFLENNGILYHRDGTKRIADNALVALTLLIAESKTDEMDLMVKVVVNLINQNN